MIITVQKPVEEIENSAAQYPRLGIIGCGGCAAVCQTGGTKQVEELARELSHKEIVFTFQIDEPCDQRVFARELKRISDKVENVDAIIMLACGTGLQVAAGAIEKPCLTGLNTVFPGTVLHSTRYEETCVACGECILNLTAGICPRTRCPKGIQNGPCSEKRDEKCSVYAESDCVWVLIEKRRKNLGLDSVCEFSPINWSKNSLPRRIPIREYTD